ncbi:MAG: head completion/stabilization protein [Gammaproteobacteria bacterium]|nr:head completion/stabilization protein [Gammaproteobacteria bacterium]
MPNIFAPTADPNNTSDQAVANNGFFPDQTVAAFKASTRTVDTVTDQRVVDALSQSIIETNRALADWQAAHELLGITRLADVDSGVINGESELVISYRAAVFARAKALIIDKLRDIDTSREGDARANEYENTRDGYLREAIKNVLAIMGRQTLTVELI